MNQWVSHSGTTDDAIFIMFALCNILGSAALLNRTIAAKLRTMLSTPWMPPLSCSHMLSAGNRSQWATQV